MNGSFDDIDLLHLHHEEAFETDWATLISPAEALRRETFGHEERRIGFTLGRIAIRRLLARDLDYPPERIPIRILPDGRLEVPGIDLRLSLAHSGRRAIAAKSSRPVGVDLELVKPRPDDLLDYILNDDERPHIDRLEMDDLHRLYVCWTLKEAVLKASGTGLRRSPHKVHLRIDQVRADHGLAAVVDPFDRSFSCRYHIDGDYVWSAAVADADAAQSEAADD